MGHSVWVGPPQEFATFCEPLESRWFSVSQKPDQQLRETKQIPLKAFDE